MNSGTLSGLLDDVRNGIKGEEISFGTLLENFHERGFGFFLFLFALPAALPIPALGINVVVAMPLLVLTAQQAWGRKSVWLPDFLKKKEISRKKLESFMDAALPWLHRLEFLLRPRLAFLVEGRASNFVGLFGLAMALMVSVPLPLTNTVPSMGIALMSVGLLMGDGLAVAAGVFVGTAWAATLALLGHAGMSLLLSISLAN